MRSETQIFQNISSGLEKQIENIEQIKNGINYMVEDNDLKTAIADSLSKNGS